MRILFTDGGSIGNGSASQRARMAVFDDALGSVVVDRDLGSLTNNEAEYRAISAALEYARDQALGSVEIRSDSQLCVNQVMGRWKVKEARLAPLVDTARRLLRANGGRIVWVRREENRAGHFIEFGHANGPVVAGEHFAPNAMKTSAPISAPVAAIPVAPAEDSSRARDGYCVRCGEPLARRAVDHRERRTCTICGWTLFDDPKVATAAIVSVGDSIVLCRRAIDPGIGKWSFPAGFVDRGEVIEDALRREVHEEIGLEATVGRLIGVYSRPDDPVVLIVYAARASGTPRVSPEATEVGLFSPDDLPEMAFSRDQRIIEDWRR
ncbi:MAG: NUDIX domain-containing protein [Chloroflexota bacterium]|nr:MAG: NUDIX domain-containing protein [Chloroflexota bacterium]